MKKKHVLELAVICLFAFLGGFVSDLVFKPTPSHAESQDVSFANLVGQNRRLSIDAFVKGNEVTEQFYDAAGNARLNFGLRMGQPVENFIGEDGQVRLQLAIYPGNVDPNEQGLPFIGFSDNKGALKMLFRLAGRNGSPVIVMKDNQHRDRIVMGLALNDANEEPFLAIFDKNGNKKMIFGEY